MFHGWVLQLALYLTILVVIARPFGEYMALVFEGQKNILSWAFVPVENILYKFFGINPEQEMDWKTFAYNVIVFNLLGIVILFLFQITQQWLPLNPQHLSNVRWDTALNNAISYVAHTDWQSYASESTMSYFTVVVGMGVQSFLSVASGMAVAVAFIHGFSRKTTFYLGNFWVLVTRSILYILLPLSIILSIALVAQGTIQNFKPNLTVHSIQGTEQIIPQGPVASQVAIKHVGANGGGIFLANSAHPFENPTPLTDYLEILGMMIIAVSFPFAFGAMMNNRRQGLAIFIAMGLLYFIALAFALWSEFHGNPLLDKIGVHHGINMEGKEVRFGTLSSVVFSMATAVGASNSLLDSFMPLTTLVLYFNIATGGVFFGCAGSGIIGILFYAIVAMLLVSLMTGRSPEIYGKKLNPFEMIMVFILPILQLILSSIGIAYFSDSNYLTNSGSHGLFTIMYNYASGTGNSGSSLGGLSANNVYYNITIGLAMLAGRFLALIPTLSIAGSLVQKRLIPRNARFPATSGIFIFTLIMTVIIIGSLAFFPLLTLGPILEHLSLFK